LRYFFEVEDLSYALELPGAYENYLQDAGFSDISVADDSGWYRRFSAKPTRTTSSKTGVHWPSFSKKEISPRPYSDPSNRIESGTGPGPNIGVE
jgi:hypothetical protein